MQKLIGHIGRPHDKPYKYSDVRCARKGFLSIFTYNVDTMSHPIEMMDRGHAVVVLPVNFKTGEIIMVLQPRFNLAFAEMQELQKMRLEAVRKAQTGLIARFFERMGEGIVANAYLENGMLPPGATPVTVPQEHVLTWELPAGMIEAGEDPAVSAVRELAEETGFSIGVDKLTKVATYHPSIGGTTEQLTAYIADVTDVEPNLEHAGDGQESIAVWSIGIDDAMTMLRDGRMRSASSNILLRELQIMLMRRGLVP